MEPRKIIVRGAREHNLRNLDLEIPKDKLVVFTGVSGSGKSSLAIDTLYAEGQRRYVESLSAYARQFLGQMEKPRVDQILGLSPAISIEQRSAGSNPRSTVGTVTEIYDYLRVLYARVGDQHCPRCDRPIGRLTAEQMVREILRGPEGRRIMVLAPLVERRKGSHEAQLRQAREGGFVRVRIDGQVHDLEDVPELNPKVKHDLDVVVDRLAIRPEEASRLTDSVETALELTGGKLRIADPDGRDLVFSEDSACSDCGIGLPELSPQLFSFNSPQGMCPGCGGLGTTLTADPELIVPDPSLSLREGAILPYGAWDQKRSSWRWRILEQLADHLGIGLDQPFRELPEKARDVLLYGSGRRKFRFEYNGEGHAGRFDRPAEGVVRSIDRLFHQTSSEGARRHYLKYIRRRTCIECGGARLRSESLAVRFDGRSIQELTALSVGEARRSLASVELRGEQRQVGQEVLREVLGRLGFLESVGLHYLTLDRSAPSLSGGEAQRIRLASQIGCGLTGVLYILDEPSIGLHPRDNRRLLESLISLRDLGNTVIVVEHDRSIIESADHVVDFGPGAGEKGGRIVAQGSPDEIARDPASLTGLYLSDRLRIEVPGERRRPTGSWITLEGCRLHNLQELTVRFPVGLLTCVAGVSGSGKSSLVAQTLDPILSRTYQGATRAPGPYRAVRGLEHLDKVIRIDQKPIGRTPRSNPATYVKAFQEIRALFSRLPEARVRGFKPGRFSFNVKGGRCETCQGAGVRRVEMHFLPDVFVVCSECDGRRFNRETLDVQFKGLTIADVLDLEIHRALELFRSIPRLRRLLQALVDVGLDYIKLGQPAPTLSGGEAQRVKLARELGRRATGRTIYILDEPTTGLHFADIEKLLIVLGRLVETGNTVIVIEHNLDVIRAADWIIELGPEGGDGGGRLVAQGSPEEIAAVPDSHTGRALRAEPV